MEGSKVESTAGFTVHLTRFADGGVEWKLDFDQMTPQEIAEGLGTTIANLVFQVMLHQHQDLPSAFMFLMAEISKATDYALKAGTTEVSEQQN